MKDIFRPPKGPARTLYDAFQEEAAHREGRSVAEWILAERQAVWTAARDYAQQHGLRVPAMDEVKQAENCASGHIDYGAKWAYAVAERFAKEDRDAVADIIQERR